jgi:hypothetical protein
MGEGTHMMFFYKILWQKHEARALELIRRCLVMAFDGGDGIASHDPDVRIIFDRGGMGRAQRNRNVRPRQWLRDGSTHPGDRCQLMAKQ